MNGDALAIKVRSVLRDVGTQPITPTSADYEQGKFWDDRQLRTALNAAQYVFINHCLTLGLNHLISGLTDSYDTTGIISPTSFSLPSNYLHYTTGLTREMTNVVITDRSLLRPARVYLGLEGVPYMNVKHNAIIIINNAVWFKAGRSLYDVGVLYYYHKPSFIGLTSLGDNVRTDFNNQDFDNHIYDNIIAIYAAMLMGMKEVQTQRDVKNFIENRKYLYNNPKILLTITTNAEQKL